MELNNYYNDHANNFYNNTININMTEFYNSFIPLLPKTAKILDAGCGSGRDTLFFINKGYNVVAFDSSEEMVKLAKKLTHQNVIKMDLEEINYNNEFDGIWASASLLHITKSKIKGIFHRLFKSLKTNGIAYASFKYGKDEFYKNDLVYNCYDEDSIKDIINTFSNIIIIKIWKTEDLRPDRAGEYWLNIILQKV